MLRPAAHALRLLVAVTLAILSAAVPVAADTASAWQRTDHTAVRLVSAVTGVGGGETL